MSDDRGQERGGAGSEIGGFLRTYLAPIVLLAVVVAVVAYLLASRTETYQANTRVLLNPNQNASITSSGQVSQSNVDAGNYAASQLSLFTSPAVLRRGVTLSRQPPSVLGGASAEATDDAGNVGVMAQASTPGAAVAFANGVAQAYLDVSVDSSRSQLRQASDSLDERIQGLRRRADRAENDTAASTAIQAQLQSLISARDDLAVRIAVRTPNGQIVDPATAASRSNPPLRIAGLGLVIGLFVGLALALLRETLRGRLRNVGAFERESVLGVVGSIPAASTLSRRGGRLPDRVIDSMQAVWLRLQSTLDREPRTITVTSASPDEDATTVAADLATAVARLGRRVIVVSADLRDPRVERRLGAESSGGLTALLSEHRPTRSDVEAQLRASRVSSVRVLPAGSAAKSSPAALLSSGTFEALLGTLRELADLVILDAPGAMEAPEALLLAATTDAVLVVASVNASTPERLKRAERNVRDVNQNAFTVVNRTPREG